MGMGHGKCEGRKTDKGKDGLGENKQAKCQKNWHRFMERWSSEMFWEKTSGNWHGITCKKKSLSTIIRDKLSSETLKIIKIYENFSRITLICD